MIKFLFVKAYTTSLYTTNEIKFFVCKISILHEDFSIHVSTQFLEVFKWLIQCILANLYKPMFFLQIKFIIDFTHSYYGCPSFAGPLRWHVFRRHSSLTVPVLCWDRSNTIDPISMNRPTIHSRTIIYRLGDLQPVKLGKIFSKSNIQQAYN